MEILLPDRDPAVLARLDDGRFVVAWEKTLAIVQGDGATREVPAPKHVTALAAAGGLVLVGCDDGSVRRFDLATSKFLRGGLSGGKGVREIAVGTDGVVWVADRDRGVRRFSLETREELEHVTAPIYGYALDPPRSRVFGATPQLAAASWAIGETRAASVTGTRGYQPALFLPDGRLVVGEDASLVVLDAGLGRAILTVDTGRRIRAIAADAEPDAVWVAHPGAIARHVLAAAPRRRRRREIRARHAYAIATIVKTSHGLATLCRGESLKWWTPDAQFAGTLRRVGRGVPEALAVSPDGRTALVASRGGCVVWLDASTGSPTAEADVSVKGAVVALACSTHPKSGEPLAVMRTHQDEIKAVRPGGRRAEWAHKTSGAGIRLAALGDGSVVADAQNGEVRIRDGAEEALALPPGSQRYWHGPLAIDPSGRTLVTTGPTGVQITDLAEGTVRDVPTPDIVRILALDGDTFLAAFGRTILRVCLADGKTVSRHEHVEDISAIAPLESTTVACGTAGGDLVVVESLTR